MREVYFKSILIADTQNHTARFQNFEKGLNVITSVDNHVGKSSLLKSLYYALGAEVEYDHTWDRNSKLYVVNVAVDDIEYQICRFIKRFAVFQNKKLLLITESVMKELAPFLANIFDFAVYLPNKETGKVELAPPSFTFMPYYIDQDTGWSGLYDSFASIMQYKKDDRIKSLYYHLNIYTKKTVEMMAQRDKLIERLESLQKENERLNTILAALQEECDNLPPADTMQELEAQLELPQQKIKKLIAEIGETRNNIQQLEVQLLQQKHKLSIITEYNTIRKKTGDKQIEPAHICPQCGYVFEREIFEIVRSKYTSLNEEYMLQQIQLIIEDISKKLASAKKQYVILTTKLSQQEKAYNVEKDEFDTYIRQRGLHDSVRRFKAQLTQVRDETVSIEVEIKKIRSQLKKLPNKKDVEEKYVEYVRLNIMNLDAWNPKYDGNIHLLKPIKAQGTLENKIILAQFVGLFQTMEYFKSEATRFPFVVDSPRAKEASFESSKDILKMIAGINMLPQVILATIDYSDFQIENDRPVSVVELKEKRKLLCESDYTTNEEYISTLIELLKNT